MEIQNRIYTFQDVKDTYSRYIKNPDDLALIEKAYRFADLKHQGQMRKSGDPYVTHCIGVAKILSDLGAGPKTICAGFLHDTIEDTGTTKEEISKEFGEEVATLVEALTKVTRLSDYKNVEFTAENHRKIFVAMAKDVRVIIVKLADRLHNMRTLQFQAPEKQQRIAGETLDVYAPIAHRLGLYNIQTELEDLSLYYLEPAKYALIEAKVKATVSDAKGTLEKLKTELNQILAPTKIPFAITDRVKSIYSIYKKMYQKNYTFEQIYDVLALRVITETEQNCYEILGYIHANFKPVPGRFKDYIAMPKANMYQSLHTTVVTNTGHFFEIQIRTQKMDDIAESGVAAHWRYKEGTNYDPKKEQVEIENQLHWFKDFVHMAKDDSDSQDTKDFVDELSHDIFDANVYVFTPKGNVICLPTGSTTLDFAYRIHTDLGEHLSGAKINGTLVPISQALKTGDIVEVIVNKNSSPNSEWLNIAKTNFARNKIRKYLVKANADYVREDGIKKGRQAFLDMLKEAKIAMDLNKIIGKDVLAKYNVPSMDDLFLLVSGRTVSPNQILDSSKAIQDYRSNLQNAAAMESKIKAHDIKNNTTDSIILPNGDSIMSTMANCCRPIPGDDIVGFVSQGQGVKIHRADCPNVSRPDVQERLIQVCWNPNSPKDLSYPVDLDVQCHDRDGLLIDILSLLNANNAKVTKIIAKAHNSNNTATVSLTIMVKDKTMLTHYITALMTVKSVYQVDRLSH
ncbi:MAG: bifunctional (p)ppGpp synthetase/guanosine-3',5'-bis(diphosphate) 3'-pyrophosphohydrolase [Bacilli bacterium]|jgi:GTP pyrophosphokinase|nr:bifunctional (p)ppGpp synthetase/guanosine-3',5'-bis(diphosphate) 3'-pyrophosphohydrolase [Bacilli bacterium]